MKSKHAGILKVQYVHFYRLGRFEVANFKPNPKNKMPTKKMLQFYGFV